MWLVPELAARGHPAWHAWLRARQLWGGHGSGDPKMSSDTRTTSPLMERGLGSGAGAPVTSYPLLFLPRAAPWRDHDCRNSGRSRRRCLAPCTEPAVPVPVPRASARPWPRAGARPRPRAREVNGIPIRGREEEVISFLSCLLNTVPQRGIISNVPHDMNPNRFSNDQLHHLLLCNLSLTTLKIKKKIKK